MHLQTALGVIEENMIIAALPAYNEERSIAKMVLGCKKYVDKVVVVDDGSTDATAEIAEALGAYVVRHPTNMGYGAALRNCFETARELGADKMVIIDADGQHDPGEIPKLLEPLNRGMDLVIGSRFLHGNDESIPGYRKVGMKVLDAATNIAGEIRVSDSQSGFRAYGKRAIERIRIHGNDMSAGSEILLQIKEHDLKFEEVEIGCSYDGETSTHNPIHHGLEVLASIMRYISQRHPLAFFGIPGMLSLLCGIYLGTIVLYRFNTTRNLAIGTALLTAIFLLTGIFSLFTGIILYNIGNQISRLERT